MRPGTTRLLFVETPSNPLTEVFDIAALSEVAHGAGALLVVDNCFCSPALQRPLDLGADLIVHSATKYLDGQGRVLGGAVLGKKEIVMEGIFPFLRTAARQAAGSVASTYVVSRPNLASIPNRFTVAPKIDDEETMCSPAFIKPMQQARIADMPDAVATHASAPSSAASRSPNAVTVGLVKRE